MPPISDWWFLTKQKYPSSIKEVIKIKKNRLNQKNKRFVLFNYAALAVVVVLCAIIFMGRSQDSTTGASISVKYYGLSDYPMSSQAGKIQTFIDLKQPTLMEMTASGGRAEVVDNLLGTVDFSQGIVEAYQKNPILPLPEGDLDKVVAAAGLEKENFRSNTVCWKRIGENYGHWREFKMVLVSGLTYNYCLKNHGLMFAYVNHDFFEEGGNNFLCHQEGGKLFLINTTTGGINTNTTEC